MAAKEYNIAKIAKGNENDSENYHNTLDIVKTPPIIIDSHIHIMTSYCTPLPLLWETLGFAGNIVKPSSKSINELGNIVGSIDTIWESTKSVVDSTLGFFNLPIRISPLARIPLGQMGVIAKKPTTHIGDKVAQDNSQTYKTDAFKDVYSYKHLFSAMIVMPMDMEYSHYDGFSGETIYYFDEYHNRYFVYKYQKEKDSFGISRKIVWLDKEETDNFVRFSEQEEDTRCSAVQRPLQLIPLYHFEPRRWIKSNEFQQNIVRPDFPGVYLGFKMYTSLGYKPTDYERLPSLKDFYAFCNKYSLPIVAHCSPSGMPTHERPLYLQRDYPKHNFYKEGWLFKEHVIENQPEELRPMFDIWRSRNKRRYDQNWETFYFSESYVAPKNWEPVLRDYPGLRLCLAHFGGDDKGFSRWGKDNDDAREKKYDENTLWDLQIIDMIKKYENCFVDISYFLIQANFDLFKEIIEDKKSDNLKNKILFGTDWYMIERSNIQYESFCRETKTQLDAIDKSLWIRFSCLNPMRFFNLNKEIIIDKLAEGLEKEIEKHRFLTLTHKSMTKKQIGVRSRLLKKNLTHLQRFEKFIGYAEAGK